MGYIGVVDYGVGNLKSVSNALHYIGLDSKICHNKKEINCADGLILPGVGAFPDAAERLRLTGLGEVVAAVAQEKPILGICLGMQLLFSTSNEIRTCNGLGLIAGHVSKIQTGLKLPHIGWNELNFPNKSPLFLGLNSGDRVYFVHSFCCQADNRKQVIAETEYGACVTAAVQKGIIFGTQFHPEKSGEVGIQILKNFGEICK